MTLPVVVGRHEELADRLVELTQRPADHQLPIGERADQFLDGGHVADASGANVQSRNPQTPVLTPGVLALNPDEARTFRTFEGERNILRSISGGIKAAGWGFRREYEREGVSV